MVNVEQDLTDYQELLEVFVQALIKCGWATRRFKSSTVSMSPLSVGVKPSTTVLSFGARNPIF